MAATAQTRWAARSTANLSRSLLNPRLVVVRSRDGLPPAAPQDGGKERSSNQRSLRGFQQLFELLGCRQFVDGFDGGKLAHMTIERGLVDLARAIGLIGLI